MNKQNRVKTAQLRDFLMIGGGFTRDQADNALNTLLSAIKRNLRAGKDVVIQGVCVLGSRDVKEHTKKGFGVTYEVGKHKKLTCVQSRTLFKKPDTIKPDKEDNELIDNFAEGLEKLANEI